MLLQDDYSKVHVHLVQVTKHVEVMNPCDLKLQNTQYMLVLSGRHFTLHSSTETCTKVLRKTALEEI